MKLTFIPAPESSWREVSSDDALEEPPTLDAPASSPIPPVLAEPDFLGPLPRLSCPDCPDLAQFLEARQQAGYYRSLFLAAKQREANLQSHTALLQAEIRILRQRLFGSKSETRHSPDRLAAPADPLDENPPPPPDTPPAPAPRPRRRGQQPGRKLPARRDYSHLPSVTEEHVLPADQSCCPCCQQPFAPAGFDEDSSVVEIEVKAYRRVIRRRRYRRTCQCPDQPVIWVAPNVPRVIPGSRFGVSVWVTILLDKYLYHRPTARLLDDLRSHGLDLSAGTITDDLKRLAPLFEPIYQHLIDRNRQQALWNADETRWPVFQVVADKVGHRWYLWLFESKDCAIFTLDKGRAHDVPEDHFGADARGIAVVDRYSAYKAMSHVKEGRIRLAFCWAHQRRDFLEVEKSWPKLSDWAAAWVERIGQLYHLNAERLTAKEKDQGFAEKDRKLQEAVEAMSQQWREELADERLHPAKRKVLSSMKEHWEGLTVFVSEPSVPLDNNQAERTLRKAVLGRKNYQGSGAEWSGQLAARMFSLLATLSRHGIEARKWLKGYLQACAQAGGKVPPDVGKWLPWNLTAEQKKEMALEPEQGG